MFAERKTRFERATIDVESDGLSEVALRDTRDRAGHFCGGPEQVVNQCVDRYFHLTQSAPRFMETRSLPGLSLFTDDLSHSFQLMGHLLINRNNAIEHIGNFSGQSRPGTGQSYREVA